MQPERANQGQPVPAPAGRRAVRALAAQGTCMGADQARVEPALVDEDQPGWVDLRCFGLPRCSGGSHVHSVLLARPQRLCLRTQPSRFSARRGRTKLRFDL